MKSSAVAIGGRLSPKPRSWKRSWIRDRFAGSEQRLREGLQRDGLTETELREQLLWQITVLQFINQRFRGGVVVTDQDVRSYYDQHLAELRREYPKNNSFDALEPKIHDRIEGERINQSFNEWLDQARKSERVEFKPGAFGMSRPMRILRNAAIALAALILVLVIAGVLVVQSAWFRNYVKQTIITSVEDSTGGKAEIGTFPIRMETSDRGGDGLRDSRQRTARRGPAASRCSRTVESPPVHQPASFVGYHLSGDRSSTGQRNCLSRWPYQYSFAAEIDVE